MRLTTLATLVIASCVALCAHAEQEASPARLPEAATNAIDGHFLRFQKESHVPGLVWGVVKGGQLVYVQSSGLQDLESGTPVGEDSLFRIASMSKAFTALAILKLRDEGQLSLDDLAEVHVPELRAWRYPTSDSPRIRIRDLLSHTAGLVTDDPWGDRQQPLSEQEFTRMLEQGVPFSRAPQTAFEYSNFGYALLGRIVANVSGRPYDEYIRSEIMCPLGMKSTGYEVLDAPQAQRAIGYRWENEAFVVEPTMAHGTFGAMGGVQTSARDYAKWVAFLLDAWPARDGEDAGPVSRATVRELAQGLNFIRVVERPGLEGDAPCQVALAYGKGMIASEDCALGFTLTHGGGYPGYGSNVLLLPDRGIGLFVFANRTYAGPSVPNRLAALELLKAGVADPQPAPVSEDLVRAYELAGEIFRSGELVAPEGSLAMNFLMDRSAGNW